MRTRSPGRTAGSEEPQQAETPLPVVNPLHLTNHRTRRGQLQTVRGSLSIFPKSSPAASGRGFLESKCQQTFSVKDQVVNLLGLVAHTALLQPVSSAVAVGRQP